MAITHSIPCILHVWEQTEEAEAKVLFQYVQKTLRTHTKNGNCRLELVSTKKLVSALEDVVHKWEVQIIHLHKHKKDYFLPEYEPLKSTIPDLQSFKNIRLMIVSGDLTTDELKNLLDYSPAVLLASPDQKVLLEYYYATLAKGKNLAEAFEEIEGPDMLKSPLKIDPLKSWNWFDSENILGNVPHALYFKKEENPLNWSLRAPVRLRLHSSSFLPSLKGLFSSKTTLFIAASLLLAGLGFLIFLLVKIQSGS